MGLSKSTRILILLGIDTVFFLFEVIVGYAVHSLALVADSFHMLNDVLSLCVGLWAVKVANSKKSSNMYTYGWQRAETLGALINGVFLVALCLSIFLEAIQRFFEPQEVSHPKLVFAVGCMGLTSNIIGLFLFHEHGHGHSHGHSEEEHFHSHAAGELGAAEEGHSMREPIDTGSVDDQVADESGNVADVLPQNRIGSWPITRMRSRSTPQNVQWAGRNSSESTLKKAPSSSRHSTSGRRHSRSGSRAYSNVDDIYIHPASFRNEIIAASRLGDVDSGSASEGEVDSYGVERTGDATETSSLLKSSSHHRSNSKPSGNVAVIDSEEYMHKGHRHNHTQESGHKSGHSHGDLNMKGVFLHVMGDALGNIGVIVSALFIWLTRFSWRFYADPLVSLIITAIILCSAIPLCKAASRILLQAVPAGISVDDIKSDILELPGIVSCHHLHVWQLSDTKLVASLHVQVAFDFKGEGSARYMSLARAVRRCLHAYGIHSSTIQPEFCLDASHGHAGDGADENGSADESRGGAPSSGSTPRLKTGSRVGSTVASLQNEPTCLLECGDECARGRQCCTPGALDTGSGGGGSGS